jgi:hypothetical protein
MLPFVLLPSLRRRSLRLLLLWLLPVAAMATGPAADTGGTPVVAAGKIEPAHDVDSAQTSASGGTELPPAPEGTVIAPDSVPNRGDEPERITQEEYTFAGSPRYTLTGDLPFRTTNIQTRTISIFGGALVGLAGVITVYQLGWYPDSTQGPFNFQADWEYSKQIDKVGHIFGGWMGSYTSYEALIASGLSKEDAAIWGTYCGIFWQTFIEVQDGFHTIYGFDWTDEVSNVIGAGYFYAQQKIPSLQNYNIKMSFGPHGRDSARNAAQIRSRILIDDYDAQNVWLSAKVHNILPASLRPYWPKWLCLAIGAGAKDVELQGYQAYRTFHISLDYDLMELLPDLGSFGNWLKQGINGFHLPAPALQIYPDVRFEILFPFRL